MSLFYKRHSFASQSSMAKYQVLGGFGCFKSGFWYWVGNSNPADDIQANLWSCTRYDKQQASLIRAPNTATNKHQMGISNIKTTDHSTSRDVKISWCACCIGRMQTSNCAGAHSQAFVPEKDCRCVDIAPARPKIIKCQHGVPKQGYYWNGGQLHDVRCFMEHNATELAEMLECKMSNYSAQ